MKTLILQNNVKNLDALNKGTKIAQQWLATIGLDMQFSFRNSYKQFTSVPFSNATNSNGYAVNSQEIFNEAKGATFDAICLVYDWTKIVPQPTNPMCQGQNIQIPEEWYNDIPEVFAEFFLHELCHYFFQRDNKPDITHNYDPAFGQKPRKDWYLYLIKPFIGPTMPVVTIKRGIGDSKQTLGELSMAGFTAKTLELPWRLNQRNVSCIPTGTYTCKYTFSPKFLKFSYEVQNVPGRSGIRIHSGNFFFDMAGCILLGDGFKDINQDGKLDVVNSRATISRFEALLGKKDFTLQIS